MIQQFHIIIQIIKDLIFNSKADQSQEPLDKLPNTIDIDEYLETLPNCKDTSLL